MMKNKAMVYILGFMVAIIWGIIIYRIVAAVNKDDEPALPIVGAPAKKEPLDEHELVRDTNTLKLNYRDPFGQAKPGKDTVQLPVSKLIRSTVPLTFKPAVSKPTINWSFIKYSGYIRNPRTKQLIALMNINGKSLMLSEGESAEQVKIVKNMKDSIKVAYNNHTKFIAINTGL
jgi:hypothetical protein